ncbi:MAG: hypothetical protein KatS3mg062_0924 [Tepidiforma sp.]|nr:MAG: hypothetical protein KatS3mg062_0924 [Tepidiforma sp.]
MAGWRVRRASPEDAAALARLRWEFRVEAGEPVESEAAFLDRAARWMAARLAGDRWQAWLAEVDGAAPAGCIWLQVIEKLPNPGDEEELHGYVTSLFVAPALRGKGTREPAPRGSA